MPCNKYFSRLCTLINLLQYLIFGKANIIDSISPYPNSLAKALLR